MVQFPIANALCEDVHYQCKFEYVSFFPAMLTYPLKYLQENKICLARKNVNKNSLLGSQEVSFIHQTSRKVEEGARDPVTPLSPFLEMPYTGTKNIPLPGGPGVF